MVETRSYTSGGSWLFSWSEESSDELSFTTFPRLWAFFTCRVLCTDSGPWCSHLCRNRSASLSRTAAPTSTFSLCLCFGPISFQYHDVTTAVRKETISLVCLCWERRLLIRGLPAAVVELVQPPACIPHPSSSFCSLEEKPFVSSIKQQPVPRHSRACKNK